MADIILENGQSIPPGTQFRYRDMGDGTHALVVYASGGVVEPVTSLQFDTAEQTLAYSQGRIWWNANDQTINIDVGNTTQRVTLQVGQEQQVLVRNATAADWPNAVAGIANGSVGFRPTAVLAQADDIQTAGAAGMTTQAIARNTNGFAATFGIVRDVDTQTPGWNEGDLLYLSETTAGELKNTVPTSGYTVVIGRVLRRHPTQGMIIINPRPLPAFGDVVNNNHTEFEYNGFLVHKGDARPYVDENFDALRQLGASAPDLINLDTTSIKVAAFDGSNTLEESSASRELQHDYAEGTDIIAHVHWMPVNANAGNVEWFFEYYIKESTNILATGTLSAVQAATGTAWEEQRLDLGTIDGTNLVIGAQVSIRLYRDPNGVSGNDTYGSDAAVTTFGYHYRKDTSGSRTATAK